MRMARRKSTPERRQVVRKRALALSRRTRTGDPEGDTEDETKPEPRPASSKAEPAPRSVDRSDEKTQPEPAKKPGNDPARRETGQELSAPPDPRAEPWPASTPPQMRRAEPKRVERS